MTAHDYREHVAGCFRCDLSRDEVATYEPPELHSRNPLDADVAEIPSAPDG